jgi:hypothetical protein
MCKIWLTQHPKHKSGFELKQIAVKIHHINSEYERTIMAFGTRSMRRRI